MSAEALTGKDARIARAAFVAMPIAAFLLDDAGRIVLHTRRAGRVYHHKATQPQSGLEGIRFSELTHLDDDGLRKAFRAAISSGQITLPMNDAHRVGVPKDVTFHLSLMRIEGVNRQLHMLSQDQLGASVAALQTANMMREQETHRGMHLEAHINTLKDSVLSMETFANAASHDLRSPINVLGSLLDLFKSRYAADLPETALPYLDHMEDAVARMEALTSKLLAHAQSSAAPMEMTRVDLHEAIASVLDLLDPTLRTGAEAITQSGPPVRVMAELTMLHILLGNIVSNALKHAAQDRPLRVDLVTQAHEAGAILSITDTGTGFPSAQANSIFAPFRRLKTEVQGTGLGLATCAEICRRHGWDISAHSDGANGATFRIRFPATLKI